MESIVDGDSPLAHYLEGAVKRTGPETVVTKIDLRRRRW